MALPSTFRLALVFVVATAAIAADANGEESLLERLADVSRSRRPLLRAAGDELDEVAEAEEEDNNEAVDGDDDGKSEEPSPKEKRESQVSLIEYNPN